MPYHTFSFILVCVFCAAKFLVTQAISNGVQSGCKVDTDRCSLSTRVRKLLPGPSTFSAPQLSTTHTPNNVCTS